MSFINFARVMLAALPGGRDATSGKILPRKGAFSAGNFNNFDEVMAWDTQIRYYTRKIDRNWYVVDTPCWKRMSRYSLLSADELTLY